MILGDSRLARLTEHQEQYIRAGYQTHIIFKRGAKLEDLECLFDDISEAIGGRHSPVIVVIAAGINNLTRFVDESRELVPSGVSAEELLLSFLNLREAIKRHFSWSFVIVATLPPIDFYKYNSYREEKGKLTVTIPLLEHNNNTDDVVKTVIEINEKINKINTVDQFQVRPKTISLHSNVLNRRDKKFKLLKNSLYDGLHPTRLTELTWLRKIHSVVADVIKPLTTELNNFFSQLKDLEKRK